MTSQHTTTRRSLKCFLIFSIPNGDTNSQNGKRTTPTNDYFSPSDEMA